MKQGLIAIVLAVLSMIVAGYTSYEHNDKQVAVEMATLKTKEADDHDRLERIENKVDQILDKIR